MGLGGPKGVRARPRIPGSSPPPTRRHCRYRRHLVPGLLLDPNLPAPEHVEPRILVPAPSGLPIGPARARPDVHAIGPARSKLWMGRGLMSPPLRSVLSESDRNTVLFVSTRQILFRKNGGV